MHKKTLGLYCAAINHHNSRRNCKFLMFRFPKQEKWCGSGFRTLVVKTLDTFPHRHCTTMNCALIILKSHNSHNKETKKRLKCDAIPPLSKTINTRNHYQRSHHLNHLK